MIEIEVEAHRSGIDTATCRIGDQGFVAQSRAGAIHKICRMLRDAGVPDQPWEVPGRIGGTSIYWMADRTIEEGDAGMRTRRFQGMPNLGGVAQQGGSGLADGGQEPNP